MAYTFQFKTGTHTYNVGTLSAIAISVSSVVGSDPWTIQFTGTPNLKRIFPNDLFVDSNGHNFKIVSVNRITYSITVTNSEYDSGTPATGSGTVGRWHNLISAWYSQRAGNLVADTRNEICSCYNDGEMTDGVNMNACTTSSSYRMTITSPVGERHRFKAGSGFVLNGGTISLPGGILTVDDDHIIIEWIELIHWGENYVAIAPSTPNRTGIIVRNNILHNEMNNIHAYQEALYTDYKIDWDIYNNLMYGCSAYTFDLHSGQEGSQNLYNNYIDGLFWIRTTGTVKNNIFTVNSSVESPAPNKGYNLGVDFTPDGDNSINSTLANLKFIDSANYDFRIKRTSTAYQTGINLSATFTNDLQGASRPLSGAWDIGPLQAFPTLTLKTIGTSGRDYSTISSWEADAPLDLTDVGTVWKGEVYNDSLFDERVLIGTRTTSSSYYMWLYVPLSQRHNGVVNGGGATLNYSGSASYAQTFQIGSDGNNAYKCDYTVIDGMKIIRNSNNWSWGDTLANYSNYVEIKNCLFYCPSGINADGGGAIVGIHSGYNASNTQPSFHDNIIISDTSSNMDGLNYGKAYSSGITKIYNNTIYGTFSTYGMRLDNSYGATLAYTKNNYVCNIGAGVDYVFANDYVNTSSNFAYNASDDATAGTSNNNVTVALSACRFVNTTSGTENVHIKSTSLLQNIGIGPALDSNVSTTTIENLVRSGNSTSIGASLYTLILGKTIGTSGRDYSTIASWEADCPSDLVAEEHIWKGECYADSIFTEGSILAGIVTDSSHYIWLTTATQNSHNGKWNNGKVVIYAPAMGYNRGVIDIACDYVKVNKLQILVKDTVTYPSGINVDWGISSASNISISENIITFENKTLSYVGGITIYSYYGSSNNPTVHVYDNIIYDIGNNINFGIYSDQCVMYAFNNTVTQCGLGIYNENSANQTAINNLCVGNYITDFTGTYIDSSNNMSSDTSAPGISSLTLKLANNNFVSIVSGSEDLRLKTNADAIGKGVDLTLSGTNINYDITGYKRAIGSLQAWDIGAHQLTITSTIGTSGRDYSTISSWNASCPSDLTTAGVDHNWIGYCYADSPFTDAIYLNVITDINHSILLTAPVGQRHNGTAYGGGVVIDRGGTTGNVITKNATTNATISWLRITNYRTYGNYDSAAAVYGDGSVVENCIIHNASASWLGGVDGNLYGVWGYGIVVNNCIIYNINGSAPQPVFGILADGTASSINNNTVYNVTNAVAWFGKFSAYGIKYQNTNLPVSIKNNISMLSDNENFVIGSLLTNISNNMTSDVTAPGANSLINKVASNQFISITSGSENLHLKTGSDAIKMGATLANSNYDIDNFNRLSGGYTWDIGAHQFTRTLIVLTDVYAYYYRLLRNQRKGYLC